MSYTDSELERLIHYNQLVHSQHSNEKSCTLYIPLEVLNLRRYLFCRGSLNTYYTFLHEDGVTLNCLPVFHF